MGGGGRRTGDTPVRDESSRRDRLRSLTAERGFARALAEAFFFTSVGGDAGDLPVLVEHVVGAEALGQLARLGVPPAICPSYPITPCGLPLGGWDGEVAAAHH
jgi:hypothetical protein